VNVAEIELHIIAALTSYFAHNAPLLVLVYCLE
jgi:hypothetical protein